MYFILIDFEILELLIFSAQQLKLINKKFLIHFQILLDENHLLKHVIFLLLKSHNKEDKTD